MKNKENINESTTSIILSKIDRYLTKLALCRVKDILINESNRGYYRNFINIKENIEIDCETKIDSAGNEYDSIKNIIFWSNGFYGVNTVNKIKVLSKDKK